MNIFDKFILEIVKNCGAHPMQRLSRPESLWPVQEKNPFLMERDTAVELGGYPKESINLILPSFRLREGRGKDFSGLMNQTEEEQDKIWQEKTIPEGVYCIGNPEDMDGAKSHISFGKIVLLETEDIADDDLYAFTQEELLTDARIRMKDVMQRQSPTHYHVNLRIGKAAQAAGFNAAKLGWTVHEAFCRMEKVKSVTVILILGESELYRELFGTAEKVKEVTLTLNHIFDSIEMDCGHCEQNEICSEIEGMRALHRKKIKGAGDHTADAEYRKMMK